LSASPRSLLACLPILASVGCATLMSPAADEDLGRLFDELYHDVHGGRVRSAECGEDAGVRWCRASFESADDFFDDERNTVITLGSSAKILVVAMFRSGYPNEVQLMLATAQPDGAFPNELPGYLVQRYPRDRWQAFEADPANVDPRDVMPPEVISKRLRGTIRGVIFQTLADIHQQLLEAER
jgi:hypothetical protein